MAKVPLTNKPGVTNWVEKYNALPKGSWIRRAAEHLKGKGRPESVAIPIAVNAAEKLCATGDLNFPGVQQASAGSRAEACAAVAVWKRAAAQAKADLSVPAMLAFNYVDLSKVHISAGWTGLREPEAQAVVDLTTAQLAGQPIDLATTTKTYEDGSSATFDSRGRRVRTTDAGDSPGDRRRRGKGGKWDESKHPRASKGATGGGRFVKKGDKGSAVEGVQDRLGVKQTGKFDEETKAAVKRFQQRHGLVVDGVVGRQTAAALRGRKAAPGSITAGQRRALSERGQGKRRR